MKVNSKTFIPRLWKSKTRHFSNKQTDVVSNCNKKKIWITISNPGSVYIHTEYLLPTQRHKYTQSFVLIFSLPQWSCQDRRKSNLSCPSDPEVSCYWNFLKSDFLKVFFQKILFSCEQPKKKKIGMCWYKHLGFSQIRSFFSQSSNHFPYFPQTAV